MALKQEIEDIQQSQRKLNLESLQLIKNVTESMKFLREKQVHIVESEKHHSEIMS